MQKWVRFLAWPTACGILAGLLILTYLEPRAGGMGFGGQSAPYSYADAVRQVDLEGLTQVEAARRAGVSVSGMKSRVQRGRAQLRELLDACCRFDIDSRGRVVGYTARDARCDEC